MLRYSSTSVVNFNIRKYYLNCLIFFSKNIKCSINTDRLVLSRFNIFTWIWCRHIFLCMSLISEICCHPKSSLFCARRSSDWGALGIYYFYLLHLITHLTKSWINSKLRAPSKKKRCLGWFNNVSVDIEAEWSETPEVLMQKSTFEQQYTGFICHRWGG